jgi:signal transduction histidine kinase
MHPMKRIDTTQPERPREERPEPDALRSELQAARARLQATERRFRSIIQRTADGIVVVDADGRIVFANAAAGALFGRETGELVDSEFGHPLVVGESTEVDIVRGGETEVVELRVVETEWEGEPARIVSLRDITDRRQAEERRRELIREQVARAEAEEAARRAEILAEAGRRLASSIALEDTLQNVVEFMADEFADYCILDLVEPDGTRRFGAARGQDGPGPDLRSALGHPLTAAGDTPQARVFRTYEPLRVERVDDAWLQEAAQDPEHLAIMRRLGPRSLIMVPLFTGRECLGLLSAARTDDDARFTDRELQLAAELGRRAALAIENARLYQEAEAANEAKTNFLSVMSHELRTPLSAIIGYADLLDRGVAGDVTEKQGQYLGRIRASSNHLLQIIEEILAFAGTEAGEESARPESTTLGELMEAVTAVATPLAEESDLAFDVTVDGRDEALRTDARKVRQILLNLISNAFKFTEEGSVTVDARIDGDHAVFRVADTGIGIPDERQTSIFERFTQVEAALTRKVGGTGLGLSVARSFARMLGGELSVESEEGVGSTFTLRIPRTLAD